MKESLKSLLKVFDGVQIQFGLEQQGHIPTVERMLAEGKTWDEIGDAIGWHGPTAEKFYDMYLKRKKFLRASRNG